QRRCRAAAAGAVLKPSGGLCGVAVERSTKEAAGIVPVAFSFYISYNNIRIDNRYLSRRMVKKF
ncbi:hypothetical protein L3K78_07725, partial [Oscillospiraceae bacterium SCCA1]|nr:hypothetical protein [Oscillospiraceae bacterium SCCA1]